MAQSPTRKAEDRKASSDYSFFFRRLVFFAAFAAAFFLRLAIAALLAMKHGGCRISARRESTRTAFGIYYSTAKKTALPLNETCTPRPRDTLQRDHAIKCKLIAHTCNTHDTSRCVHR